MKTDERSKMNNKMKKDPGHQYSTLLIIFIAGVRGLGDPRDLKSL